MISQFVSPYEHRLLGDLNFNFPPGTQAVGRLDEDSEGLLILTNDKSLTGRLLHPDKQHKRAYVVRVLKKVEPDTLKQLRGGIEIKVKQRGIHTTRACEVVIIDKPQNMHEIDDNFKEFIPHTWLKFVLTEGKNRQIRKMCRTVGHRCKRLIRVSIEDLHLNDMKPGDVKEINQQVLFQLLKLE